MRSLTTKLMMMASVLAIAAGPVRAADLFIPEPEPVYSWEGLYSGIHVGYGWGDVDNDVDVCVDLRRRRVAPLAIELSGPPEAEGETDELATPAEAAGGTDVLAAPAGRVLQADLIDHRKEDCFFNDRLGLDNGRLGFGSTDVDGWLAGSQVGYNWQYGSFVLGLEGDLSWTDMDGDTRDDFILPGLSARLENEINWIGTIRGRLGLTMDRFMVFASGGFAAGEVETTLSVPAFLGYRRNEENTHTGWTVGAGVEGFITPNITARIEYLYVDLGDEDSTLFSGDLGPIEVDVGANSDVTAHIVRGALNYKLDLF